MNNEYLFLSGYDPDAKDKGGGGSGRQPRKVDRGRLPIALPLETEKLHGGSVA